MAGSGKDCPHIAPASGFGLNDEGAGNQNLRQLRFGRVREEPAKQSEGKTKPPNVIHTAPRFPSRTGSPWKQ